MKKRVSLADTVLLGTKHFKDKALKASCEEEKQSLNRCAEASVRLGAKLKLLEQEHTGDDLAQVYNELPERRELAHERKIRSQLTEETQING